MEQQTPTMWLHGRISIAESQADYFWLAERFHQFLRHVRANPNDDLDTAIVEVFDAEIDDDTFEAWRSQQS